MDVEGWKDWMDPVVSMKDVSVRVVNCRPYGKSGMLQYVELSTKGEIEEVITQIKNSSNVLECEFTKSDKARASGLVITKHSPICRGISKFRGFCTTCLLSGDLQRNRWRIVIASDNSLDQMLSSLEGRGVSVKVTESKALVNGTLTFDQYNIIKIAEQQGYFEFPRKISLTKLAERLDMSKSNLEEILRRAEHKITANYVRRTNDNLVSKGK